MAIDAKSVKPKKWKNILILFDDGSYSAIWGNYENSKSRVLGVRWNGEDNDIGYPNLAGNPLWYVEPLFLRKSILLTLLYKVIHSNLPDKKELYNL